MEKAIVIGGSGFMGSHVSDELSRQGYSVTIFDNKPSPWLKEDQEMIVGDMLDLNALRNAFRDATYVYHFAGIADIGEAAARPYDTIYLNVMGATAALDEAVKAGIKRFIYASTMYVYSPYGSFYRASKQAAENIVEVYNDKYGLDYTILRYGSLYGPRAQEWNGLRKYVTEVIQNGKLNYPGKGNERREYIHVMDAARLSVDILDDEHINKSITVTGHQVLNSSELIEMIFEIAAKKMEVKYEEDQKSSDHYTMTPYRYTPKVAKKLVPDEFVDIGQGILEIVEEVQSQNEL